MGQHTLQKLRGVIQTRLLLREIEPKAAINARQRADSNVFRKLPSELIQLIFKLLSDVDKICFGLSNNAAFYGYATPRRPIGDDHWPPAYSIDSSASKERLSKRSKRHKISLGLKDRAELFLRLQDKRSLYCRQCYNIHKRSIGRAFRSFLGLMPKCSPRYGPVVEICPCSTLPVHQAREYMMIARMPESEQQLYHRNDRECSEPSLGCEGGNMQFTHQCTFKDHFPAIVHIRTRMWLDKGTMSLQLQNVFRFDVSELTPAQLKHLGNLNVNKCMHQDTKGWLQEFFKQSKPRVDMDFLESDYCQWLGWEERKTDESPQAFGIVLHRDLGGARWHDKRWVKYSHPRLRPHRPKNVRNGRRFKASHF